MPNLQRSVGAGEIGDPGNRRCLKRIKNELFSKAFSTRLYMDRVSWDVDPGAWFAISRLFSDG